MSNFKHNSTIFKYLYIFRISGEDFLQNEGSIISFDGVLREILRTDKKKKSLRNNISKKEFLVRNLNKKNEIFVYFSLLAVTIIFRGLIH